MNTLKYHLKHHDLKSHLTTTDSVYDAITMMRSNSTSYVVILEKDKYVGIFTESDLKNRVAIKKLPLEKTPLRDVMTKDIVCFDVNSSVEDCLSKLKNYNFCHLPILKKNKVIAVLSARSLFKIALKIVSQERNHLMQYITA